MKLPIFVGTGVSAGPPNGLLNNLVSYWDMESGIDLHGSNDLTIVGASTVTGKIGNAQDFDGANDYGIKTSNSSLNMGTSDFAINGWFDPTVQNGYIFGKKNNQTASAAGFIVRVDGWLRIADGSSAVAGTVGLITDTSFYMLTINFDRSGTIDIYKNNSLIYSTSSISGIGSVNNLIPLVIGGRYNSSISSPFIESFYNGIQDEMGLYKGRLLDSDARTALYNGGAGLSFPNFTT